jgi:hypothetical protein
LNSPWEAPDDLDDQIAKLLLTTEPILMALAERANKEGDGDNRDKDNAQKQMATIHLKFIEDQYVEKDDDASHYTWGDTLTATRMPKVTLFAWVDSFTSLALRYMVKLWIKYRK